MHQIRDNRRSSAIQKVMTLLQIKVGSNKVIWFSAIIITALYNRTFWVMVISRMEGPTVGGLTYLVSLFLVMLVVLVSLIFLFSYKRILKYSLALTFILCSVVDYFNRIGVVIDENMIENILITDFTEASELVSASFFLHVLLLGLVPSFIISQLNIIHGKITSALVLRFSCVVAGTLLASALILMNFQYSTFFSRENRDLRIYLNPLFPIYSVKKSIFRDFTAIPVFQNIGGDALQVKTTKAKTVGIIIIGETARADHFPINGYSKNTTPLLNKRDLINYSNVSSCGTSTAYSVPCIFSFLSTDTYSPEKAKSQSNLLDVLEIAGVKTLWRDNNSTCKGVCARIETENFRNSIDETSEYFNHGEYLDEVLLSDLRNRIDKVDSDILIVLHQLGSHGPAYYKRYTDEFKQFTPDCQSNAPQNCSKLEVNNSFDNSVVYTDYFINQTIRLLEENSSDQSFMLYVSDHGESLGENGIYLHGLPRAIAPKEQTHIPMFLWISEQMKASPNFNYDILRACNDKSFSHENIAHTVLTLFNVQTSLLAPKLSLLNIDCDE